MLTIHVPPDVAEPLVAEAKRRGTTPEEFAVTLLRAALPAPVPPGSLLEFLGDRVGSVAGSGETYSENTGRRFADGLAEGRQART